MNGLTVLSTKEPKPSFEFFVMLFMLSAKEINQKDTQLFQCVIHELIVLNTSIAVHNFSVSDCENEFSSKAICFKT